MEYNLFKIATPTCNESSQKQLFIETKNAQDLRFDTDYLQDIYLYVFIKLNKFFYFST